MKNSLDGWKHEDITIPKILEQILSDTNPWVFQNNSVKPWFRGQDTIDGPIPSLFRDQYDEFNLVTTFRNRANALKDTPETDRLDKWLFLMQHYGVPTRLLDWTESPLVALFFGLSNTEKEKDASLWILHPLELNRFSIEIDEIPNSWTRRNYYISKKSKRKITRVTHYDKTSLIFNRNPGVEYFRLAFHPKNGWSRAINLPIVNYPIAIHSNFQDMRMLAQRSCFTIHGIVEKSFETIFEKTVLEEKNFLLKYIIPQKVKARLFNDLLRLGIDQTSVYPDIEGISKELSRRFKN